MKVGAWTSIGMIDEHDAPVHSSYSLRSRGGATKGKAKFFYAEKLRANLTPIMRAASDFDIGFSKPPGGCLEN